MVALSAGLVALSAAGYFLFGPKGKKNRKVVKGWTLKAKGELLEKIETMKEVTSEGYAQAVQQVMKKYAHVKTIAPGELQAFAEELQKHWKAIANEHAPKAKKRR